MKTKITRLLLSAVLMMCCVSVFAEDDWTIIEQPTCSTYGTMRNDWGEVIRLVPKAAHHFVDGVCTVCGHAAPTKYNGTPADSLVTITEENYAQYGLTASNKDCVMGWTVITTAEEFMKYMYSGNSNQVIKFNAFLAEDIVLDENVNLPKVSLGESCTFDGTGHTISNVYRNGDHEVGLFSHNAGYILNLGLISPKIVGERGGCICGCNVDGSGGMIINCFVIDGSLEGNNLYGIAFQGGVQRSYITNCYAITNKGNIGDLFEDNTYNNIKNSHAATTGSVPDDFYANTMAALNSNKNYYYGASWYLDVHHSNTPYPVLMPTMTHYPAKSATCTECGNKEYWFCAICGKYFLDANHAQETTLENLTSPALGHNLSMVNGKAHCDLCDKDFSNVVAIDDHPVLLNGDAGNYSMDKMELKYGHSYFAGEEFTATDGSYTFRVNPGKWNSWFVPFAVTTDKLGAKDLTAAYIAGIRQYEKDAEGNITTQVDIIKIKNARLRAGTPYLVKYDGEDLGDGNVLTLNLGETDFAASSDVHPGHTETMTASYDFIGCYEKAEFAESDKDMYYFIGSNGSLVHSKSNSFSALDWYLKVTPKGDVYDDLSTPSLSKSIIINVIGEEDETTGIRTLYTAEKQVKEVYDLSGRRLNAPKKGQINIINGKKILVK